MSELIRRAQPRKKARYVCMEGADKLVGIHSRETWPVELRLTVIGIAQWILWHFGEAKLGHGPQPGDDASLQDERGNAETRSRQTLTSSHTRANRRAKCEMAEKVDSHCCSE